MPLYILFVGSFVFLGVSCIQTVPSDTKFEIKSLQQILKVKLPLVSSGRGNHGGGFLNAVSVRDISNAFNVVTNDSKQINQLIPKMYDVSSQNPAYIFSLPRGLKHSFLTMRRNSFDRPVFPNLTSSYVRFMRNKEILGEYFNENNEREFNDGNSLLEDRVNPNSVQEDESTLFLNLQTERNFIDYLNKINQLDVSDLSDKTKGSTDEWSLLGLHGWEGVLSKQNNGKKSVFEEIKPSNQKTKEKQNQAWDLPGRMQNQEEDLLRAMKDTKIMSIVGNLSHQAIYPITSMHEDHSDEDVYIARVNDPFGHSTKWNVKNQSSNPSVEDRKKRGVIELYSMIKCSTGCDPLVLKGYGCYCGFLGDGIPVDGIDRCCKLHDKCYEYSNCISYLEYFVPYIWKCYRGKPLCAIDHGEWGGPNSCAARLCQCDLSLSRCLRRFLCPHRRAICRTSRLRMLQNLLLNF